MKSRNWCSWTLVLPLYHQFSVFLTCPLGGNKSNPCNTLLTYLPLFYRHKNIPTTNPQYSFPRLGFTIQTLPGQSTMTFDPRENTSAAFCHTCHTSLPYVTWQVNIFTSHWCEAKGKFLPFNLQPLGYHPFPPTWEGDILTTVLVVFPSTPSHALA